jgi:polar amino acid transport system substrate-binding protein
LRPVLRGAASLWEPYQFLKEEGGASVVAGFDVEVCQDVFNAFGYDVEFHQILDKAVQLEGIENGTIDFTTSPRFADRERYATFSDPIRREINVLYVRSGDERFRFKTVAEMIDLFRDGKLRLAVVRGREYGPVELDNFITDGKQAGLVTELETVDDLVRALTEKKNIDAFLMDRLVGETVALRMNKQPTLHALPLPPECSKDICLMFSKKTVPPDLVTKVNKSLARLKATIRYGQIVRFYALPILLSVTVSKPWFLAMDLIGTFAFAISGALLARKEHYSLIGGFVMATLPTVGGGLVRDLIVERRPVGILRTPYYMIIIVTVILAGFVISKLLDHFNRRDTNAGAMQAGANLRSRSSYALQVCDALGLSAFLIVGVVVAVETRAVPILLWGPILATLTGCGGGILRDVVRADAGNPMLKTSFYGEVALIWGFIFSVFLRWETWRLDAHEVQIAVLLTFLGAFITRMAIVHFRIRSPSF